MRDANDDTLHKTIIANPWLAAHPLFWTAQHLDLLECRFEQDHGQPHNAPRDLSDLRVSLGTCASHSIAHCEDDKLIWHVKRFATSLSPRMKSVSLGKLLISQNNSLAKAQQTLAFFYAKRQVHVPNCSIYHVDGCLTAPLIGYINYDNIIKERSEMYKPRPSPGRGGNPPVQRLYERRLSKATPVKWFQDPYLICVLLSLAQWQSRTQSPLRPDTFLVRLLVTTASDTEDVHVFGAEITAKLLEILDQPTLSTKNVCWPIVKHSRVHFEPYPTFSERVMGHLSSAPGLQNFQLPGAGAATAMMQRVDKRKISEDCTQTRRTKIKNQ